MFVMLRARSIGHHHRMPPIKREIERPSGGDSRVTSDLPPGVRWPSVVQTVVMMWFNERWVRWCSRRFDSMVTVRLFGAGEFVLVWDPGLLKELFTADRDVVRAGEAAAGVLGRTAPSSLLTIDGERHLRMRRLMSAPFHGQAVRQYRELIAGLTAAEVQRWPVGEEFAVQPRMQAIALEVILRAVIGIRDQRRMVGLRSLLPQMAQASAIPLMAETKHPWIAEGRIGARLPWVRARRAADVLLYEEIAAHRADPDDRQDILALLMAARDEHDRPLTDQELRDQLVTLLLAGQETTATALAWCFERLVRHPATLARLKAKLDSDDGDAYLDAVIHETLRVRPPIDGAWRKLAGPLELGGYRMPAGTLVVASFTMAHASEAFAQPDQFYPERFLDQPPPAYAWIPFGGGPRRCIGASFAVMEMKTILRTVLQHVELRAPTQKPERRIRAQRITTFPARGGRVIVTSRNQSPDRPTPQADAAG
jgi:cytochrome P450 family 135